MLVKYREDNKKVAMGLLSFVPGLRDMHHLQDEFDWYAASDERELLLWRDADQHFTAIVGIEHTRGVMLLRQISLTPSLRDGQYMFQVLDALIDMYPEETLMGTIAGQRIVNAWRKSHAKWITN